MYSRHEGACNRPCTKGFRACCIYQAVTKYFLLLQVVHTPAAVGQPLFIRVDDQSSSLPPTASSVLLITDAPVDRAIVFGTHGFCALNYTHEVDCLCKDLVTAGMYDQVHMHLEQRILYKHLNAGFQKRYPGSVQCTSELHGCEDFLFQKRILQAAQGRVRLVQATDFCSRGAVHVFCYFVSVNISQLWHSITFHAFVTFKGTASTCDALWIQPIRYVHYAAVTRASLTTSDHQTLFQVFVW